jgi:hypothetical protein
MHSARLPGHGRYESVLWQLRYRGHLPVQKNLINCGEILLQQIRFTRPTQLLCSKNFGQSCFFIARRGWLQHGLSLCSIQ